MAYPVGGWAGWVGLAGGFLGLYTNRVRPLYTGDTMANTNHVSARLTPQQAKALGVYMQRRGTTNRAQAVQELLTVGLAHQLRAMPKPEDVRTVAAIFERIERVQE